MKKYLVSFKWRDLNYDENKETKEFTSKHKAIDFKNKIEKKTEKLLKVYGKVGIYNPYYDINFTEVRIK